MRTNTKIIFFKLLDESILIAEFENFIYKNSSALEKELKFEIYLELLCFEYKEKNIDELKEILNETIDVNEFEKWQIKNLIDNILVEKINIVDAAQKLNHLFINGNKFNIPNKLGSYYSGEFDDIPTTLYYYQWEKSALQEKLNKIDLYKEEFLNDVKQFSILIDE